MSNTATVGKMENELKKMAMDLSTSSPNRKMRKSMRSRRFYLTAHQSELAAILREERQVKHKEFLREQTEKKVQLEAEIAAREAAIVAQNTAGAEYLAKTEVQSATFDEAVKMDNGINERRATQIAEAHSVLQQAIAAQEEEAKILASNPKKMDAVHAEAQAIQDEILVGEARRLESERLAKEQDKLQKKLYGQAMMMPKWRRGRWLRKKSAQYGVSFN